MNVTFRHVEIETGSPDREGLLVFDGECLVALLIQLSEIHEDRARSWYLEYGPTYPNAPEAFDDLVHAKTWMDRAERPG